jgi:hypothetical protein
MEVVQRYTVDFHETLQKINNLPPSIEPTATGHIVEQIEIIKDILQKGMAYEINGSVYFDVLKYNETEHYGILSGRNIEDSIHNTRAIGKEKSAGFCALEKSGRKTYYALAFALGRRFSRLAFGMYCHEHKIFGRDFRHSWWRNGLKISASRM